MPCIFRRALYNPLFRLAAVLPLAAAIATAGPVFYISPNGSDANPGTETQPFLTIEKARDAVRAINGDMTSDILVYLHGGTYRLSQTLTFDARDSGTNSFNVVYKAHPGETPVVSGGERITGWRADAGGRWRADTKLPDFRQLYVNGSRCVMAHGGGLPGAELYGEDGYTSSDARMANWANQDDIEFVYDVEWSRSLVKVSSIKPGQGGSIVTMQQPYFRLSRTKDGVQTKLPTYIQNAMELLDEPGEWYLNRKTHVVYYLPRSGENPAQSEVIAPVVERLVEVKGSLDAPIHNICFQGITFAHAGWTRPSESGHIDVQANFTISREHLIQRGARVSNVHDENIKSPSAIVLHAAEAVRFERCTFTKFGSSGIDLEHGARNNIILGCKFHDLSGSAIQVGDVIDHHPLDRRVVAAGNQIVNNYIHDVAKEYVGGVGIFAGYADDTLIAHNEICHLPYTGISIGWGWGEEDAGGGGYFQPFYYHTPTIARKYTVQFNHIHHVMQQRNDGGGIYTLGMIPYTVLRGNYIHDSVGKPGGVYLDEGTANVEVTGNIVHSVPKSMNYNNNHVNEWNQNRKGSCSEHDNYFDIRPDDPRFPRAAADAAGIAPDYEDLLNPECRRPRSDRR